MLPVSSLLAPAPFVPSNQTPSCSTDLLGPYEFPHLILPVSKAFPNQTSGGTDYYAYFSTTTSTVFTFDFHTNYANSMAICSLVFLLSIDQRYTITGSGGIVASLLSTPVSEATTYSILSAGKTNVGGIKDLEPGTNAVLWTEKCAALGARTSFLLEATGSLNLTYFQTSGEPANGLWVREC